MDTLENMLTSRSSKEELTTFMKNNPKEFSSLLQFFLGNHQQKAWRGTWLISHCMEENDERVKPYLNDIIEVLPHKKDGHQRELLKVLGKMKIAEELEGKVFDECVNIWKKIEKSPSVRMVAFKILVEIAKKHPELKREIRLLFTAHYVDTLSPGIKNSLSRLAHR